MKIPAKVRPVGVVVLAALLSLGATANAGYQATQVVNAGGARIREVLTVSRTAEPMSLREQSTEVDELLWPRYVPIQMIAMIDLATPTQEFPRQMDFERLWSLGATADRVNRLPDQPNRIAFLLPQELLATHPSMPRTAIGGEELRFHSGHLLALFLGVLLSAIFLAVLIVSSRTRRFWRMIRSLGRDNRCDPYYRYFY